MYRNGQSLAQASAFKQDVKNVSIIKKPSSETTYITVRNICQETEKSESIACVKEMPVIPVNKVVDPKRIIGKNGGPRRRRGTRGL
jgi:hypothetical protein